MNQPCVPICVSSYEIPCILFFFNRWIVKYSDCLIIAISFTTVAKTCQFFPNCSIFREANCCRLQHETKDFVYLTRIYVIVSCSHKFHFKFHKLWQKIINGFCLVSCPSSGFNPKGGHIHVKLIETVCNCYLLQNTSLPTIPAKPCKVKLIT